MVTRLSLRARIFLFFATIAGGAVVALAAGLWFGYHRNGDPRMLEAFVQGAIVASFAIVGLVAGVWYLFDTHFARPIEGLAGAIRARAHAGVSHALEPDTARYLGDLVPAASAATATLAEARNAAAERVARETARLSADKANLEEILADVPPGVLLCTGRHRLVFYNGTAQQLLSGSDVPLCLDRNLFDYLRDGPIREAHQRLLEADAPVQATELLCTTPCGKRRLAVRMRLVGDTVDDPAAYVLTLRDVTAEITARARRDTLLGDVFDRLLPAVAALEAAVGDEDRAGERAGIRADVLALRFALDDLVPRYEACLAEAEAPAAAPAVAPPSRSVAYDFELLARAYAEFGDKRLDELTYVVFDTETTGLMPDQGDEIVQIAAVRIVNGKRVRGEAFDLLVNPGRAIPAASTAVHGVTDAMVADAPDVADAVARFHRFAEGAVLVAHNAPFDMEFLRRREAQLGLRFDNPVFDTIHLSAAVFGRSEPHSLDALAKRLGIVIPEEARHTAIGDAVATADVFIKLLPMLSAKGICRFADVLAESRRHRRLVKDANRPSTDDPMTFGAAVRSA